MTQMVFLWSAKYCYFILTIAFYSVQGKRYIEHVETDDGRVKDVSIWKGGSESYMFNQLEEIAKSEHPQTPVLGCR